MADGTESPMVQHDKEETSAVGDSTAADENEWRRAHVLIRAMSEPGSRTCETCGVNYNLQDLVETPPTRLICRRPGCDYLVHPWASISYSYCCRECNWTNDPPKERAHSWRLKEWMDKGSPPHGKCCVRRLRQDVPHPLYPQTWTNATSDVVGRSRS